MIKILMYNVFNGISDSKKFAKLIKFIKKEDVSILVLTELNNWQSNDFKQLKEFKEKTGFKFNSFLEAKTNFNIGVFSKIPISYEEKCLTGFHHGLVKVKINDITILATHLNPFSSEKRMEEIKNIIEKTDKGEKTIITGDLNSISPHDKYDETELLEYITKTKTMKFGNNRIEYTPIKTIEEQGFFDAYLLKKKKTFKHTVPTIANKDSAHFTKLRLDYFFVSSSLKNKVRKIQIRQNKLTNQISDHYPVVLVIDDV